jgi:hypothetical protein
MSTTNHRLHRRALELAAGAIDFSPGRTEATELQSHLAACAACARSAAALRTDAAALRLPAALVPSRRVDDAVYAAIAGRQAHPPRLMLLVAATVLLMVALLGVAAAGAVLLRSWQPLPIVVVVPSPSASPAPSAPLAAPSAPPAAPSPGIAAGPWTVPASLPVAAGGVRMAPGPDGGLYVLVSSESPAGGAPSSSTLALLGADGQPRPGWPLGLTGWRCDAPDEEVSWPPVPAGDGSVSIVCRGDAASGETAQTRAFAFDSSGSLVGTWSFSREIGDHQPRIIDGRLVLIDFELTELASGDVAGAWWLVTVAKDGAVRTGRRLEVPAGAMGGVVRLGPDGIAYRAVRNEITAFDIDGVRAGWPIQVDGELSAVAFGPDGRIYPTSSTEAGATRLLVFDRDGRAVPVGSEQLPIEPARAWSGEGPANRPIAPLVAPDGTSYVIGEADGRAVVFGIDPSGRLMAGWPHRAATPLASQGSCTSGSETGCGTWLAVPSVGQDGTVYLPLAAPDAQIGGSFDAVGPDGTSLAGWPMHLARRGAEARSILGGPDGTIWALAVEPESGGSTSATILAVTNDGTVLSRTTVVNP